MKRPYDSDQILERKHFQPLSRVLAARFSAEDDAEIENRIHRRLCALLEEHQNDDDALWEESSNYILPSIAVYLSLREFIGSREALGLFRTIYFEAAYVGAAFLRKKAECQTFREKFPNEMAENKKGERGGFRFHLVKMMPMVQNFMSFNAPTVIFVQRINNGSFFRFFANAMTLFMEVSTRFYGRNERKPWGVARKDATSNSGFCH